MLPDKTIAEIADRNKATAMAKVNLCFQTTALCGTGSRLVSHTPSAMADAILLKSSSAALGTDTIILDLVSMWQTLASTYPRSIGVVPASSLPLLPVAMSGLSPLPVRAGTSFHHYQSRWIASQATQGSEASFIPISDDASSSIATPLRVSTHEAQDLFPSDPQPTRAVNLPLFAESYRAAALKVSRSQHDYRTVLEQLGYTAIIDAAFDNNKDSEHVFFQPVGYPATQVGPLEAKWSATPGQHPTHCPAISARR